MSPGKIPVKIVTIMYPNRKITGSISRYSPIPPNTPANTLFVLLRVSSFFIALSIANKKAATK